MLSIANNVSSLIAQANLAQSTNALSIALQQLSSGKKINTGADNPSGLVTSQQQLAQIAGLNAATQNTAQAINAVQTGDGALTEVGTLLTTARGLALDAANTGTNDQAALNADQAELNNIISTINNIANTTQFNGRNLLDGSAGIDVTQAPTGYSVAGTAATATGTYTLTAFTAAVKANASGNALFTVGGGVTALTAGNLNINGVNIALNATNANTLAATIQTINSYASQTGVTAVNSTTTPGTLQLVSNQFGAAGNFTATFGSVGLANAVGFTNASITTSTSTNGVAATNAAATLTDANSNTFVGVGSGNVVSFNNGKASGLGITFGASGNTGTVGAINDVIGLQNNSLVFQIGANAGQSSSIAFGSVQSTALGQGAQGVQNASFTSLNAITINTTPSDAQDAIRVIDKAIQDVTNEQASLGAFQANTLQGQSNNLQTELQNTTAAESTVADTDFAAATSNMARYQVLTQAGAAVLSSANQTTQLILALLQKLG
jgi:flagellin